jgi:cytochrome b subunit of formate dehydrogenase
MKNNTKEWIQYSSAVMMLVSGIVLAFLCFFLNHYDITDGVLLYVAQCISLFCIVVGAGMYVYRNVTDAKEELKTDVKDHLKDYISQLLNIPIPDVDNQSKHKNEGKEQRK